MALTLPDLSGWVAALALAATAALPLFSRVWLGSRPGSWPPWYASHFWLGRLAAATGVIHCLASVTPQRLLAPAELGVWLASVAAALLVVEAVLGSSLRDPGGRPSQPGKRRIHLALLAVIAVMGGLHVLLDVALPI